jgi:hypothetical protein
MTVVDGPNGELAVHFIAYDSILVSDAQRHETVIVDSADRLVIPEGFQFPGGRLVALLHFPVRQKVGESVEFRTRKISEKGFDFRREKPMRGQEEARFHFSPACNSPDIFKFRVLIDHE